MGIDVSTTVSEILIGLEENTYSLNRLWKGIHAFTETGEVDEDENLNRVNLDVEFVRDVICDVVDDIEKRLAFFGESKIDIILDNLLKTDCFTLKDFYTAIVEGLDLATVN